jgi:hypothetical protein
VSSAPTGFELGLPPGWVALDPRRRIGRNAGLAPADADIGAIHGSPEGPAVRLIAKVQGEADAFPFEAALAVGIYRLPGGNDPAELEKAIEAVPPAGSSTVVILPSGPVVRWSDTDRRQAGLRSDPTQPFVLAEFYIPVPASPGQVAVLTFSARGPGASRIVLGVDAIAETFAFTFDGKTPIGPVLFWSGLLGGGTRPIEGRKVW